MIIELGNNQLHFGTSSISLGDILENFISESGMTKTKVAELLGLPSYRNVNNIIEGTEDITLKCALGIAELVKIPMDSLISSANVDMQKRDKALDVDRIRYASFLYSNFDIKTLRDIGLLKKGSSEEEMCKCLIDFFGYNSIYDYKTPESSHSALFSKKKVPTKLSAAEKRDEKMKDFWLVTAYQSFVAMNNPNDFNSELLSQFLQKRIQAFTKDVDNGFAQVVYVLYQLGVSVIVQDYMSHTNAYGVSMIVNDKPCIVLTGLGGNYYKLWCTLLHELYHILHDWEVLKNFKCMVSDANGGDLFVSEEDANMFAYKCFIPEIFHKKIALIIDSKSTVEKIAEKLGIHPTLVYGIYLELIQDKELKNREFRNHIYRGHILSTKDTRCVQNIIYNPVKEGSVRKGIEKLKEALGLLIA